MKLKSLSSVVLLLVLFMLFACSATVPLARFEQDAKAKEFLPLPGKAKIYLARNCAYGGALHEAQVNGAGRVSLSCMSYHVFIVPPGNHHVAVQSTENRKAMRLDTEAGKIYFVEMGWFIGRGIGDKRATVKLLDENTGKELILQSKLISDFGY